MSQYHFIDPLYFKEALDEFGTWFEWFPVMKTPDIDDLGRKINKFDKQEIYGSLQPRASSIDFKTSGNTHTLKYDFYCMSKYRINLGDFIHYHDRYLMVDEIQEYDEAGVRQCSLTMVNLTDYRDFQDYLDYLNGDKTV